MKAKETLFKNLSDTVISQKLLRHVAVNQLDKHLLNIMVAKYEGKDDSDTQMARYQFFSAILHSVQRNLDK
jgi:hypothetical protein